MWQDCRLIASFRDTQRMPAVQPLTERSHMVEVCSTEVTSCDFYSSIRLWKTSIFSLSFPAFQPLKIDT